MKNGVEIHKIINFILKSKHYILAGLAMATIVFGTYGYYVKDSHPITGILNSIKMFGLDFPSQWDFINWQIILSIIFAIITISFIAVMIFIKDSYNKFKIDYIFSKKHDIVFGLGGVSISLLNSYSKENRHTDIVVIESNPSSSNLEKFRKKGMGVLVGDAFSDEVQKKLNLKEMNNAVIALGDDRVNIELAKKIFDLYEKQQLKNSIKLIVHIQNRDLDILFHQQIIVPKKDKGSNNKRSNKDENLKIDIKTFSFFQEVAKDLFDNHSVDGDTDRFINTDDELCSILIGNGELVKNVIYQMAQISHLPNENVHTVYIVDKFADDLIIKIKKYLYYTKDNFPSFKIKAKKLDSNSLEFFSDDIWQKKNIANIIIAYDAEAKNLDLAIELFNRTYLSKSVDNDTEMPKILFAIYDQQLLAEKINIEDGTFRKFHAFGNSDSVVSNNKLIDEEGYLIAKLINLGYGDEYKPEVSVFDIEKANAKWYNRDKYSNKLSSISQAKHIDMKLKAMGLKKKKLDQTQISTEELVKQNKLELSRLFDDERNKLKIGDKELNEYSKELSKLYTCENNNYSFNIMYFPKAYDTLFEKMIRMEHNRWNAYHYLNGWEFEDLVCPNKYDDSCKEREWIENKKDNRKDKKKHDCLIPLKDFKKPRNQVTVIYDIYSFLYLPNYLAELGYKIVRI